MAATLTVKVENNPFMDGTQAFRLIGDWVSHTDGTVSLGIASTYAAQKPFGDFGPLPSKIKGVLRSIETAPGLNGNLSTSTPTALYDITILDAYSFDIASGTLANRSASAAEKVVPTEPLIIDSELTLTIANAGDTKKGRIIFEFEKVV